MITLDKVLDKAMELTPSERDALIEILQKRRIQERRKEIANEIREARESYKNGKLKSLTAEEAIKELHSSLSESPQEET